jgi:competence protein ComEC
VRPGEWWKFVVRLRRPHGAMNPGGCDFEAWMLECNLRASGYVRTSPGTAAAAAVDGLDAEDRHRTRARPAARPSDHTGPG